MPKTTLKNSFLGLLAVLLVAFSVQAQSRGYAVQIASVPSEEEARTIVTNLKSKGIDAYWVKADVPGKGTRYRIRIGKFKSQADAKGVGEQALSRNLIEEFIVTPYELPTSVPGTSDSVARRETRAKPEPNPPADNPPGSQPSNPDSINIEKTKIAKEIPAEKEVTKTEPPASQSPSPGATSSINPVKEIAQVPPPISTSSPSGSAPNTAQVPPPISISSPSGSAPNTSVQTKNSGFENAKAAIPAAGSESTIATPPVADALADIAINNDNWKIVRRSVETDKNLRSIYFVDAMTGWAAGDAGTAYRTTDGGRTWKPLLSGAPANINLIYFVDWNNGWMLGDNNSDEEGSESLLFITTNGGKTWARKPMPNLLSLHFIDPKNGWAVGKNATLLKTSDGGNVWKKVDSMESLIGLPVESTSYSYGFRDIQFVDALHGWLIGNFYGRARNNIGGIFMTADGGATWKRLPLTIQTQHTSGRFTPGVYQSVKFSDLNTGSVTGEMYDGEGRYFFALHTRDGGKTWEQFRTPSRATYSTQFLDLSNGWMAASAPREGSAEATVYDTTLMRTDNGGMSWRNDLIAKGRRIRGVFFLSPTKGWAVGDRGMILRYEEKTKAN